ncbi:MAG: hypothetical protein E6I59_00820 [Chloroflexi bacterium]|nr:MAG: hypothetical protein E6I59_00820 [Chloroflexota bacterium]
MNGSIAKLLKRFRIGPYELCMFAVVVVATVARLVLISYNWPVTNSDEGNMGLLAMHVAYRGELPIFFYGLPYMGPLEGYIAAPLFHLLGPSLFSLRVGLLPLFALFLISMYYLTRLLYTQKFALAIVVLLSLGSNLIIQQQLKAVGEYPEMELFGALIALLACWLALSSHTFSADATAQVKRRRAIFYGLLGLAVGVAVWVDFLILPVVATAGLLLVLFCRRELRTWAGLSLVSGIIIGAFPLILYNMTAPWGQDSLTTLYKLHQAEALPAVAQHLPFLRQVIGTILISLPLETGANPSCPLVTFPLFGPPTSSALQCAVFESSWGIGFLILGMIAAFLAVRVVWPTWRKSPARDWTFEERQTTIRQCARLMLLVSAGLTIVSYMLSPVSAIIPDITSRYLICLLIAVPAVLWPLWSGNSRLMALSGWREKALLVLKVGLLVLVATTFLLGTVRTFAGVAAAEAAYNQEGALVQDLQRVGATRIYSEYWTCNRLTFRSQEQIVCSALDEQLKPGFDRYLPYRSIVRAAAHPAYVFPLHSQQSLVVQRELLTKGHYRHYVFEGYDVYQSD